MYKKVFKKIYDLHTWVMSLAYTKFALPALCIVAFIEASFFLIPPDVLLIVMGASQPRKALIYAHWCTIFSVLGSLFGYLLGFLFWAILKDYFFEYILTQEQFQTVQSLFQANTFTAILLAAFTPIPFKVFTVTGGVLQVPLLPFLLGTIIGRGLRYYILGGLFFVFGDHIKVYVEKHFEKATLILGLLFILALIYYKFS